MFLENLQVSAQDLVPVSDITGGSSVFVFRGGSKAAPKKYSTRAKVTRLKTERLETVKKINKQIVTLAKADSKRARSTTVDPTKVNVPTAVTTLNAGQASKLFAGIGEYYIDKDNLDDSIAAFRQSLELDQKNKTAKIGLSEALALKGNELLVADKQSVARLLFEEAIESNPANSAAYFGLGEVLADLDKGSDAITNYEKALTLNKDLTEIYVPLGILYYQKGDLAKADEFLSKAMIASAGSAETQYFLGLIRFAQNRNDEALAAFKRAVAVNPSYAEAYYYAGETLIRLGKPADSIAEYNKAIAAKPNYIEAVLGLGGAYYETEKYTEAAATYEQIVRLKNDNIEAYVNLGDTYRQMRNYNKAESAYNLAITFIGRAKDFNKEEAADVYSKHGFVIGAQCSIDMQKGLPCKWDAVIKSFESAVALTQNTLDYANLGWAYSNAGRIDLKFNRLAEGRDKLEKGKTNLLKVVAANPSYVDGPLMNLGVTYADLRDYENAIPIFQRIIDKRPNWPEGLNELGNAYYELGNFKEAAKQFRKVIDKDPKYISGYINLAMSEYKAGNKKEAKKVFEKLRELSPLHAISLQKVIPDIAK